MRRIAGTWVTLGGAVVLAAVSPATSAGTEASAAAASDLTVLPAGPFSNRETGPEAFSMPYPKLTAEEAKKFAAGRAQFNEAWVVAPDPSGVWGLGPTFNEDRCAHCHGANGRARAPAEGEAAARGVLVRLSVPGRAANGAPNPHPAYGDQLQNRGIPDRVPPEGDAVFTYRYHEVGFADGEAVTLREPVIRFANLGFGDLGPDVMVSARVAQQVVGLGFLEAVPAEAILRIAAAQPGLGVDGRPNYVWDHESERTVLGRFGWKANQPSLRQQTASAFHADIGATTYLFPEENCPPAQTQCLNLPSAAKCGGQGGCTGHSYRPEVVPSRLKNITFYLQMLTVPARRETGDPDVARGERHFTEAGCSACHVPELETGPTAAVPAAANLAIRPYTDLLLHDMGDGLADHRPDFEATGREWRTPPLWGIGLLRTVSGHGDLLHDGRARNVVEAILWHGGEGAASRERFRTLPKADREALVRFVESL